MKSKSSIWSYTGNDLLSGMVVFLVALPLCLGIALASGAPLFSGIIAGIIGGIVVGLLSKSSLSVSGPAAGLTVIVLTAITDLGFEAFLLAVAIAGAIQFLLGVARAGIIGLYFPSSVIKGMLAAIGLILILKQLPHLFGVDTDAFGEMEFLQKDGHNTFSHLTFALSHINIGAMAVGLVALGILVLWESSLIKKVNFLAKVPGALVAVVFGVLINYFFVLSGSDLQISESHLVNLPKLESLDAWADVLVLPDFTQFANPQVYITAITIAIVASLETLLSIEAVDKLDPQKRRTPQNAELKAQGIGNLISGLIGGLPMTAVIVRSTANLSAGGKTKMSAIYHGIMLLVAVAFFSAVLNMIPLAALAAVLIFVGYKLAKPSLFQQQVKLGFEQFVPFLVTIVAILMTDLLIGICIGLGVGVFFILRANYKVPYFMSEEKDDENGTHCITIKLSEHVSFLNKANLQLALEQLPEDSVVTIDGSLSKTIEYDALEVIENFKETALDKGITLTLANFPGERRGMNKSLEDTILSPKQEAVEV